MFIALQFIKWFIVWKKLFRCFYHRSWFRLCWSKKDRFFKCFYEKCKFNKRQISEKNLPLFNIEDIVVRFICVLESENESVDNLEAYFNNDDTLSDNLGIYLKKSKIFSVFHFIYKVKNINYLFLLKEDIEKALHRPVYIFYEDYEHLMKQDPELEILLQLHDSPADTLVGDWWRKSAPDTFSEHPLWSHEPGHIPSCRRCRRLRSDLRWDNPQKCGLATPWEQSTFTGVSSASPHAYSLKSWYGKVS